jgi:predicted DNA binding CopG/RHH family protein
MIANKLDIPVFANEEDEAEFWQKNDSTDYLDWNVAETVTLPKLRPTLKSISLRLPEPMLDRLRTIANERDIPYQSLIKMILADHVAKHTGRRVG